ncbi:Mycolic acid cyclopropane synthetase-domain-containing protein [Coniochaeta sp. 2T2.1]|nr:Mycolic acid cyclopropane synthetase-domain-containing protein [Coniochaeta sp. 2T2.1]
MTESWLQSTARASVVGTLRRIQHGQLTIVSNYQNSDNRTEAFGNPKAAKGGSTDEGVIVILNSPNAWVRICRTFDLGFSEAYMLQEIDCNNLVGLFSLYIANFNSFGFSGPSILQRLIRSISYLVFQLPNYVSAARLNASFHYDTSNTMFSSFLSPDMNYSCALWSDDGSESLEAAQLRKVHNILDKARIEASDHVLDIGCGWGHLAIEAVRKTGCRVTGLTLSAKQKSLAEARIKAAGFQDNITILLCDYRQAPKPLNGYDKVISVEMVEHVGNRFMNQYFQSVPNLVKPNGGVMVLQSSTYCNLMSNENSEVDTFVTRYIFPGGFLPSINQLLSSLHVGSQGALEVETVQSMGPHYVKTLVCWRENFLRNWIAIRNDFAAKHPDATETNIEAFRRRWLYYFMYVESGFRTGILGVHVVSAVRSSVLA